MALGGVIAALVTPYSSYGGIDTDGVGRLVEHAIAGGVQGVLVNSPVGEGPHLSRGERIFVFEAAVEAAAGRVPVYAATGAVSTEETLALTWDAGKAGVAAAFVAPPFYYLLPQAALLEHYRYLARRGRLPIIAVNDRPPYWLRSATLGELANDDAIAGIVHWAASWRETFGLVGATCPMLVAREIELRPDLSSGHSGVVSMLAGILPEQAIALYRASQSGDQEDAWAEWHRLRPLLTQVLGKFETQVAACKAMLTLLGLPGGVPRTPLPGLPIELQRGIEEALAGVRAGG